MAQHRVIKPLNDILAPANPAARDYLHSKVKCVAVLSADFKKVRNPRFHRKYFALLNLGYEGSWVCEISHLLHLQQIDTTDFSYGIIFYAANFQFLTISKT